MIRGLDHARWSILSPHLDEALDKSGDERAAWLETSAPRDSALADEIETLLMDHDRARAGGLPGARPRRGRRSPGQTLGAYTLREQIGRGGMGSVWLAERSRRALRRCGGREAAEREPHRAGTPRTGSGARAASWRACAIPTSPT